MSINEFLAKQLGISHKEALELIRAKQVFVNGQSAIQRQVINERDQITAKGTALRLAPDLVYLLYYKPRGIECTMNTDIPYNLLQALPEADGLFPVGRLDKESEGMLLLTNDGKLYKEVAGDERFKEKEYLVRVNKSLTDEALQRMREGIQILGKTTRKSEIERIDPCTFRIVLTQGMNRQIRRMCYKLGYSVESLKRIRIMSLELGDMKEGEFKYIRREDVL